MCDGLLGRHINVTRRKLGKLESAVAGYFKHRKRNHVENLHRSLFLRDLLLDGDKTLTVLEFWSADFFFKSLEIQE